MARIQLALNVADLEQAIQFYSRLFAAEPAKVRPGYANFAVVDPPLKLVLIADPNQTPGTLNHTDAPAGQLRVAAPGTSACCATTVAPPVDRPVRGAAG